MSRPLPVARVQNLVSRRAAPGVGPEVGPPPSQRRRREMSTIREQKTARLRRHREVATLPCPCAALAADTSPSPILRAEVARVVIQHLLFMRGQIDCVYEEMCRQLQTQPQTNEHGRESTISKIGSSKLRRVRKYVGALENVLSSLPSVLSAADAVFGGRRLLIIFGPTPANPREVYDVQLFEGECARDCEASAPDSKTIQKASRQVLRRLATEIAPDTVLRKTKLWLILQFACSSPSDKFGSIAATSTTKDALYEQGWVVKAGHSVHPDLILRRAKTVYRLLLGRGYLSVPMPSRAEASAPHNDTASDSRRQIDVWVQNRVVLAAQALPSSYE